MFDHYPDPRLLLFITTPPQLDGIFGYEQSHGAGTNTVYHDSDRQSHLMVPLIDWSEDQPLGNEPGCEGCMIIGAYGGWILERIRSKEVATNNRCRPTPC